MKQTFAITILFLAVWTIRAQNPVRKTKINAAHRLYKTTIFFSDSTVWRINKSRGILKMDCHQKGYLSKQVKSSLPTENTLELQSDGDILMGGYTSERVFSSYPKNFAAWDDQGVFQKYAIEDLIDTIEAIITTEAEDGLINDFGVLRLGDDVEGIAEAGELKSERFINQNDNPISFAATERVAGNETSGGTIFKFLDPQTGSSISWNQNVGTFDNAGSNTNNFVYTRGFNLTSYGSRIDPALHGWGESWEFRYEPSVDNILIEKHIIYIDLLDVQHRLESYTLDLDQSQPWEVYQTLSKSYYKDPANGNQWFILNRGSETSAQMLLTGSESGTGAQFYVDAAATNLQIQPSGFTGNGKWLLMDQWNAVALPAFASLSVGGTVYNSFNGQVLPSADNVSNIGSDTARFSDIKSCALDVTDPADYNTTYFEVTDTGTIYTPNLPVYEDEEDASSGGLTPGTWYRTSTGELRIKL